MSKPYAQLYLGLAITVLLACLTGCRTYGGGSGPISPNFYPVPKMNMESSDISLNGGCPNLAGRFKKIQIGNDITYILPSDCLFIQGSGIIYRGNYPALNALAGDMSPYANTPKTVTAYTDDIGSRDQNIYLAQQQAQNIISYLWVRGINHFTLQPVALGKQYPIATNFALRGSAFNRHIEITVRIPDHIVAYSKCATPIYSDY